MALRRMRNCSFGFERIVILLAALALALALALGSDLASAAGVKVTLGEREAVDSSLVTFTGSGEAGTGRKSSHWQDFAGKAFWSMTPSQETSSARRLFSSSGGGSCHGCTAPKRQGSGERRY